MLINVANLLQESNNFAQNYEYLIKAVGVFLPFIIALLMFYIAWQQWQTNERKRKHELLDKRFDNVYQPMLDYFVNLQEIINKISKNEETNLNDIKKPLSLFNQYRYLLKESDYWFICDKISSYNSIIIESFSNYYKKDNYKEVINYKVKEKKQCLFEIEEKFEAYLRVEKDFPIKRWFYNLQYKNKVINLYEQDVNKNN